MKKTPPLFSIIVPVYRVEQYLRQCVDSVLSQSFEDFEVLLVDDGSPDGCGGICDAYGARDPRVRVIHKENGGLVSARKAGAEACTGEYVVNVDGDDHIGKELLVELSRIIDRFRPDVITFEGYQFSGDVETPFAGTMKPGLYRDKDLEAIRRNVIMNDAQENAILYGISLKAIRRELYLQYQMPVPESISMGEDLALTAPLLSRCESVYVSDIYGYYYRMNPASIMNTFRLTEPGQIQALAEYLENRMDSAYGNRIDAYVLLRCFDFLDRGMLARKGMGTFCAMAQEAIGAPLQLRISRAVCTSSRKVDRLVFWLMGRRRYETLWLLRRIKGRRQECGRKDH